jgi:ribosome maturation factor RimP
MALARPEIEREMEAQVASLGFELVSLDWAGSRGRPIMRIRMDRPDSGTESTVTVDECAQVSRALEAWLEEDGDVPERYVLEVSSPGVERPLVKPRDWERFAGRPVVVKGHGVLAGRSTRLEADLLGLQDGPEPIARLRLGDGIEVGVPLKDIKGAHLLFNWK